ncbi:MAG: cytochrome c oxidase assembly protein [Acidimicrobiia bacterium]
MELDLSFHMHWDVLGIVLALGVGYTYGLRLLMPTLAPRGEVAVTRRQRILFFSGLGLMAVVTSWPVHDIGSESLFMFHMTEHMVLALGVPPLLLLGTPWWLLRALVAPILPLIRFATRPLVALVAFNVTLAALHAPGVVELMVTNSLFHFAAHSILLVTAVQMWWPVVGPIPDTPRLEPFPRMGYLFLQSLVPTVPASFLTLSEKPLYKIYETLPRLWDISPLTDQTVAGLIMKLGGGAVLWTAIAITFFSWVADDERAAVAASHT